jgi:hypothetical protein
MKDIEATAERRAQAALGPTGSTVAAPATVLLRGRPAKDQWLVREIHKSKVICSSCGSADMPTRFLCIKKHTKKKTHKKT